MQKLVFYAVYPLIWCISRLPFSILYVISDMVYVFVYCLGRFRRKVVRKNLELVFPQKSVSELRAIERDFYHHMCDMFLEMIKSLHISKKELQERMVFKNVDLIERLEQQYGSFILLCGHYASYEWLLSLQYHLKGQAYAIYTPLSNRYFDRLVRKVRLRYGAKMLSRYEASKVIAHQRSRNEHCAYGLVADQSPSNSPRHYRRSFLGVEVPVFTGGERIAKRFDIPVVFCRIERVKRGYYSAELELITEQPQQMADYQITDIYIERLQQQIYQLPQYYFWIHNRFKHRSQD